MAGDLKKFILQSRENGLRFQANIEDIFRKYDREFDDSEIIDLEPLSIARNYRKFHKREAVPFGCFFRNLSKKKADRKVPLDERSFTSGFEDSFCQSFAGNSDNLTTTRKENASREYKTFDLDNSGSSVASEERSKNVSAVNSPKSPNLAVHIQRLRRTFLNETFTKAESLYESENDLDEQLQESYMSIISFAGSDEPSEAETLQSGSSESWEDGSESWEEVVSDIDQDDFVQGEHGYKESHFKTERSNLGNPKNMRIFNSKYTTSLSPGKIYSLNANNNNKNYDSDVLECMKSPKNIATQNRSPCKYHQNEDSAKESGIFSPSCVTSTSHTYSPGEAQKAKLRTKEKLKCGHDSPRVFGHHASSKPDTHNERKMNLAYAKKRIHPLFLGPSTSDSSEKKMSFQSRSETENRQFPKMSVRDICQEMNLIKAKPGFDACEQKDRHRKIRKMKLHNIQKKKRAAMMEFRQEQNKNEKFGSDVLPLDCKITRTNAFQNKRDDVISCRKSAKDFTLLHEQNLDIKKHAFDMQVSPIDSCRQEKEQGSSSKPIIVPRLKAGLPEKTLDKPLNSIEKVSKWLTPENSSNIASFISHDLSLHGEKEVGLVKEKAQYTTSHNRSWDNRDLTTVMKGSETISPKPNKFHPYMRQQNPDSPSSIFARLKLFSPSTKKTIKSEVTSPVMYRQTSFCDGNTESKTTKTPSKLERVKKRIAKSKKLQFGTESRSNFVVLKGENGINSLSTMSDSGLTAQLDKFITATQNNYYKDLSSIKSNAYSPAQRHKKYLGTTCNEQDNSKSASLAQDTRCFSWNSSSISKKLEGMESHESRSTCVIRSQPKDVYSFSSSVSAVKPLLKECTTTHEMKQRKKPCDVLTSPSSWKVMRTSKTDCVTPSRLNSSLSQSPLVKIRSNSSSKIKVGFENKGKPQIRKSLFDTDPSFGSSNFTKPRNSMVNYMDKLEATHNSVPQRVVEQKWSKPVFVQSTPCKYHHGSDLQNITLSTICVNVESDSDSEKSIIVTLSPE